MVLNFKLIIDNRWQRAFLTMFILLLLSLFKVNGANLPSKIDSLNEKAWEVFTDDPKVAILIVKQTLCLADSIQYLKGLSTSNNYLGVFYYSNGRSLKAEEYFLEAIKIRKKMGYEEGVAYTYAKLCALRERIGDYPASMDYGFKALAILNKLDLAEENPDIYINLGIAHYENGDKEDAQKYYEKGLEIAEAVGDSYNIALCHYNWALLLERANEIDAAERLFRKVLKLKTVIRDKTFEGDAYAGLANIAIERQEYDKALNLFQRSIKINNELKDSLRLYNNYLEQSELFISISQLKKALEKVRQAEIYLNDIKGFDFYEKLNRQYSKIYNGLKDYKNSFFYLQKAENFKDSIFSTAKSRSIALFQKENAEREKAEAEKAKAEEELKNQQLTQSLLLVGLLSLGLCFGLYILNQRRLQKTRELSDYKDQQERMIDRRIIDATQEIRKELAHNLHNHVATPLTHIKRFIEPIYQQLSFDPEWQGNLMQALQIADKAHVVSRDISYQLKPEKIDWIDRIKISMVALERNNLLRTNLAVKGLSETAFTRIEGEKISSIISNLLSNVDQHSKATKVNVGITQTDANLTIEVVDNGIGFRPVYDKGIGLDSIYAGVQELKGKIKIDSKIKEGTTININIPLSNRSMDAKSLETSSILSA